MKKNLGKLAIVIALVFAIGAVIYLKNSEKKEGNKQKKIKIVAVKKQPQEKLSANLVKKSVPKLLDLGASKCIPCKMMIPVLDELEKEYKGKLDVVFIDIWKNPKAKDKYNIKLIPTQIFFDASGKELFRHQGFFAKKDILRKWEELGIMLKKNK